MKSTNQLLPHPKRSGFLTFLGLPNSGKSTIFNEFLGENLAIISSKPQTTRQNLRGFVFKDDLQLVLTDTPGLQLGTKAINQAITRNSVRSLKGAKDPKTEYFIYVLDGRAPLNFNDQVTLLKTLAEQAQVELPIKIPTWIVFNKIDRSGLILPSHFLEAQESFSKIFSNIHGVISTTTRDKTSMTQLLATLSKDLPVSQEPLFEEGYLSDRPVRYFASEFLREQCFVQLQGEVPYSVGIQIESFDETQEDITRIEAYLYVERDSQKAILIGAGGSRLKSIGTATRSRLEAFLGKKIFLGLHVKVQSHWSRDDAWVQRLGYEDV